MDDRILERWMALEFANLQRALVAKPAPLADLAAEANPVRPTRGGDPHPFDADAIRRLDERLASPYLRRRLRLPLTFYLDKELPGTAYVTDAAGVDALTRLGIARTEPRDGKLFLSEPLAREFAREYPTLAQFVVL